jgi:2-oxoisovalerate dehydrogenase E1 component alpha subunit
MTASLVQILDPTGKIVASEEPKIDRDDLIRMYRTMMLNRLLDERMLKLQRQGRIGFYLQTTGEEASHVGSTQALRETDWVFPAYREPGSAFLRGFPIRDFVNQAFGNANDLTKGRQMPVHYSARQVRSVSISSPVGTQIPQAAGVGMAARILGHDTVTLVFFGDGTSSQGDFHVGLNFAGVFKAPTIFICRNNQWAISTPLSSQTASESIAIKAKAYGMPGIRVDGNDVLAMYEVTRKAAVRARRGDGPTLIEALTYRRAAHSSSDDPRGYRDSEEVEPWVDKDPLERFRKYLTKKKLWNAKKEEKLREELTAEIVDSIREAESTPPPPVDSLFEDVYAEMPAHLREQHQALIAISGRKE